MIKKCLYSLFGIAALCACSDEHEPSPYLNGKDKTPLEVVTNVTAGKGVTRAVDGEFEANDELLAYIKHVIVADALANPLVYSSDVSVAGVAPKLAELKVTGLTAGHEDNADNSADHTNSSTLAVQNTGGLYWDDFSNSASDATDLRTPGHALMVYYGYCYNGSPASSITTALNETEGTLGWTVAQNQSENNAFKHSDLLWCKQQNPIAYNHVQTAMPKLTIPYTHAMSKITIEVHCNNGFENNKENNFKYASVLLTKACTKSSLSAKDAKITPSTEDGDKVEITMQKKVADSKMVCTFSAVVAPTVIKADAGTPFATLKNIDGNDYKLYLTHAIITTAPNSGNAWSTQLASTDVTEVTPETVAGYTETNGGLTKPGVNYKIVVNIDKQANTVSATIAPWEDVTAEGEGKIQFENDVTTTGEIVDVLKTGGFDVYKKLKDGTSYDADASTSSVVDPITKVIWDGSKWVYNPVPYWQNKDDKAYFRALSPSTSTTAMENGKDVMWATTPAHNRDGSEVTSDHKDYEEGGLLDPRTGDVPLAFKHVMSKITFNLVDENKDLSDPLSKIVFTNATIQITELYTDGTLSLDNGTISMGGKTRAEEAFSKDESANPKRMGFYAAKENGAETSYGADFTIKDYAVIPQEIGNDAIVTITLANGTTYKLQLNTCTTGDTPTPITTWEPGKYYNYTITLSKEQITIRALVKDWDEPVNGSGSATLDWD